MAKRFPFVVSYKDFINQLQIQSTTPKPNRFCFSSNVMHTQGGDSLVEAAAEGAVKATEVLESVGEKAKETVVDTAKDAAKKSVELVTETTIMAEADTNVVDTVEYRSSEDTTGQLGDGYDSYK
ncbi:hypothetical protein VNO77_28225 [Canavalia gladiata]|uniref:Uncharacterized protein n=1 Tax=Canavalia gladiata TaxID=3824 RepID=A0AAN9Q742_CANGL